MNTTVQLLLIAFGLGRIAIGLAPFVAASRAAAMLGFPAAQNSPSSRLLGRLFGVRDVGLGALAFYAAGHPASAAFLMLFNAAMDLGDLGSTAIPLLRREGIDRAALSSAAFAFTGGVAWVALWALSGPLA